MKHCYDDLTLNKTSSFDLLLAWRDLNARVGLRNRDSDVWSNVLWSF